VTIIADAARAAGRDPAELGMLGRVDWSGDLDAALRTVEDWRAAGATHIAFNTMDANLRSVDEHIDTLAVLAERCSIQS
jgi:hypothetical protein